MNRGKVFKGIIGIILLALVVLAGYKAGSYYLDNRLYAHYIVKSYWQDLSNKIDNGYTDKSSYSPGEKQKVFIDGNASEMEWIRLFNIRSQAVDSVQTRLFPQSSGSSPSENGFGYEESFEYTIPDLPSGIYSWENKISFILKGATQEIVVLYPTNTINAYNICGGKSLYSIFSDQTHVVSFLRPTFPSISFQVKAGLEYLASRDHLPLRYIADQDMESYDQLQNARLLIIIGHSEYWTRQARLNFDRFVDDKGNVLILSGNTMWWQVRYEENGNKMVCYKELDDPVKDPLLRTTNWTHPSLQYPVIPSIGADFPHGGFGRKYKNSFDGLKVVSPRSPLLKGTGLRKDEIIHLPTKEYDGTIIKKSSEITLDKEKLNVYQAELIAYDNAILEQEGYGSFLIFQKTENSRIVINTGTMDWCSDYGLGGKDSTTLRIITDNMIEGLWKQKELFSE